MENLENRCFKNPIYDDINITMHNNPLYKSLDSISQNNNNNNYNTLSRDNNNYSKLKLKTFNEDNIYENLDILKNKVNNKYKLPDDWIELLDEESGKYYYACLTTKHTQWLHPSIPIGTIMDNGLPYGWDYKIDPKTNEKYFINHVGRFTTWKPPVKQRKYKGKDYEWLVDL